MKKIIALSFILLFVSVIYSQNKKIDSLNAIIKSSKIDTVIADAYTELAKIYRKNDDSISFKKVNIEFEKLYQKSNYPKVGNLYNLTIALYHEKFTGDREKMIEYFTRSYDYCIKASDKLTASKRISKVAHNLIELGRYNEAVEKYYLTIKLCDEVDNKIGKSYAYFGLGEIFRLQHNLPKALQVYKNAYELSLITNDPIGLSASYNNIGMIYNAMEELDSAFKYYQLSFDFNEKRGNELEMASSLDRIATLYLHKGENEKALKILNRSLEYKLKFNDKEELSTTYINLAEANYNSNRDKEALKNLELAIRYATEAQLTEHIEYCYKLLGIIYKAVGNHKQSAEFFYKYIVLHDSLISVQSNRIITEMEEKYQNERKQNEIDVLNKDKLIQESNLKKQKQFIYLVLVVAFLLVVVVFVVIRGLQQKKKDNRILEEKNLIINEQKSIVEEKNKEITDSINYAKRIQYALLANEAFLKQNIKNHFIFFKPKDIVSGDFYWATKVTADDENNLKSIGIKERFYLAVCDSTGHGVPGAFMSLLNIGFLSEAIKEKNIFEPNKVFDYVRERLVGAISLEGQKDGFDGVLLCMDKMMDDKIKVCYVAANNAPVLLSGGESIQLPVDKMPVGYGEKKEGFKLHHITYNSGDMLYLYTDGYPDQFGGPRGKKFMYKQLNGLLKSISKDDLKKQKEELTEYFLAWKGNLEQIDDVCVIGIRL